MRESNYDTERTVRKRKHVSPVKILLTMIVTLFSVCAATVLAIYLLGSNTINTKDSYSEESTVNSIKADSYETGYNEGRKSVLDEIKNSLDEGYSISSIIKRLYPDYIVAVSSGMYHFNPIDTTRTLSNYDIENLVELENGEYQYVEDGVVTSKKGIDVSSFQGEINWEKVADDGVEFAFIRSVYRGYGSGKLEIDKRCEENIKGAKAAGIQVGVYVFTQAITDEEALEEAYAALELVKPYDIELPIVLDVERVADSSARFNKLTVEERTALAFTFKDAIEQGGHEFMIYHNTEMGSVLLDTAQFEGVDTWFAGYTKEFYWPYKYRIWQYSESGKVAGIKEPVDLDLMLPEKVQ